MFALLMIRSGVVSLNLKCDPVLAEQLRSANSQIKPGYHMNKQHWNTIELSGELSDAQLTGLIDDSYQLVVAKLTKKERLALQEPHTDKTI